MVRFYHHLPSNKETHAINTTKPNLFVGKQNSLGLTGNTSFLSVQIHSVYY